MKSKTSVAAAFLPAALIMTLSSVAFATNGYFTHGVGAKSKSMGGTGIGSPENMGPNVIASNPALGAFVGDKWEVGMSVFSPRRSYVASPSLANGQGGAFTVGAGDFDSGSEYFPIPYIARNWKLDSGRSLTLMFYGRGGMNTNWTDPAATAIFDPDGPGPAPVTTLPGPFGGGEAGVDLSQAFLSLNYAGMTSESFAWGLGPIFAVQAFEARGVATFAGFTRTFAASGGTALPTSLSNNGREFSFGIGAALGGWWKLSETVSLGLSYQSRIYMSELDDYSDLFAEQGDFDIPSSIKLGVSFKASDAVRLNFDIEHTRFGDVDSVGNSLANLISCPTAGLGGTDLETCLGGESGAGFGWNNVTTFKIGAHWQIDDNWSWHIGVSKTEQPISSIDVLFNILAPGVTEEHYTFGVTRNLQNGRDWTLAFMIAPESKVTGTNLFDPTQTIQLKMNQLEVEFSYSW